MVTRKLLGFHNKIRTVSQQPLHAANPPYHQRLFRFTDFHILSFSEFAFRCCRDSFQFSLPRYFQLRYAHQHTAQRHTGLLTSIPPSPKVLTTPGIASCQPPCPERGPLAPRQPFPPRTQPPAPRCQAAPATLCSVTCHLWLFARRHAALHFFFFTCAAPLLRDVYHVFFSRYFDYRLIPRPIMQSDQMRVRQIIFIHRHYYISLFSLHY